jgi:hypothetical protein
MTAMKFMSWKRELLVVKLFNISSEQKMFTN